MNGTNFLKKYHWKFKNFEIITRKFSLIFVWLLIFYLFFYSFRWLLSVDSDRTLTVKAWPMSDCPFQSFAFFELLWTLIYGFTVSYGIAPVKAQLGQSPKTVIEYFKLMVSHLTKSRQYNINYLKSWWIMVIFCKYFDREYGEFKIGGW